MTVRRAALLVMLLALPALTGGCVAAGALAGADAAIVAVFGRDFIDMGVSAATGRDCSVVRLDRRQSYCAAPAQLPAKPLLCSRGLADVQCWADPEHLQVQPHQVADTPAPTREQVGQIRRGWPASLNLSDGGS